ncbi:Qat anti-phage system associated protein QatB [Chamaesiphon polymorphus]|uniref:Uncharacterized protein n=1 Tax=Chamaesiphon polymorphus CCALA 037 TaxID=2107692 RepID=A0A2T1GNU8_9CYAN|nr:Qat anti-phage system associated protein QatB [Chamaesiphon polymorphus]PSB59619.1 hypothetical protein C7B77_00030 [Chamaesiphon polymorphus CCALA 037]
MGTSQSSPGAGNKSPLVPPWADDRPEQPLPNSPPQRFTKFRRDIGNFVETGNRSSLKSALKQYASRGTGGASNASRRLGNITKAGASLYGLLTQSSEISQELGWSLSSLAGISCEVAIEKITQSLIASEGDSDKVRVAMNHALVEALDGLTEFDPNAITSDIIINTMIAYLTDCIFLQVLQDAGRAWSKAGTQIQAIKAENDLREVIKVSVDAAMAPLFNENPKPLTRSQTIELQRSVIETVWLEWESY